MSDSGSNKRLFPFADDGPSRQYKVHVSEQQISSTNQAYMTEIYARTNSILFEGARRASTGTRPEPIPEVCEEDMEMETPLGELEFRRFRNFMLKRLHERDPSPMPESKKRLNYYSDNKLVRGKENKELNAEYMKFHNLRQLCLDPFMRQANRQQNMNEEPEVKDEPTDENFNNESMEF